MTDIEPKDTLAEMLKVKRDILMLREKYKEIFSTIRPSTSRCKNEKAISLGFSSNDPQPHSSNKKKLNQRAKTARSSNGSRLDLFQSTRYKQPRFNDSQ
jgi:hypothetical protein